MSRHQPRLLSLASTDGNNALDDFRSFAAQRGRTPGEADTSAAPAGAETDQLARDVAEIESAAAALRRAEPALESWTNRRRTPTPSPVPCGC
jgi:hypothetical protein